jgi:hypothetical protein
MNSKTVLSKILGLLSLDEEKAAMIQAQTDDGTILQSSNFDVNDDVEMVSEDGKTSPAEDGEYTISFTTPEGKQSTQVIDVDGGKIVAIATPEESADEESGDDEEKSEEMDMQPTDEIPQQTQKDPVNVPQTVKGAPEKGTLKAGKAKVKASAYNNVDPAKQATSTAAPDASKDLIERMKNVDANTVSDKPATQTAKTTGKSLIEQSEETESVETIPQTDNKPAPLDLADQLQDLSYRIEEMEKKMAAMAAAYPPVDSEVTDEEEGIKMESALPKLDGAPLAEKGFNFSADKKSNDKKVKDAQSSFLAKLYN